MAKLFSRYNARFIEWLKSVGGTWDPEARVWTIPDDRVAEAKAKAKEFNVEELRFEGEKAPAKQAEATITMRLSRDGRFVLIPVTLMASTSDVKQMLEGKRKSVRFRVLPPRQQYEKTNTHHTPSNPGSVSPFFNPEIPLWR